MERIESALEQSLHLQDFKHVATLALETYGAEIFGFLVNLLGNESSAEDVFGQVTEDLWRGLPSFAQRASIRTWLYTIARHAAMRYARSPWRRAARFASSSELDALVAIAQSRTNPYLRTDVKDRVRALRESLDIDDRALLVLRIDRNLPWEDIARIFSEDRLNTHENAGENADGITGTSAGRDAESDWDAAMLTREAARLRKRFQIVKAELRKRAIATGLLTDFG